MSVGVKETKEVVLAVLAVAPIIVAEAKDGLSVGDLGAVYSKIMASEELKAKILLAVENVKLVPEEVSDLSLGEIVDIIKDAIPEIVKIVEALRA